MADETRMYTRNKSERIWDMLLKALIPIVIIVAGSQVADQIRISANEKDIVYIKEAVKRQDPAALLDPIQDDIKTLLDRTARMETEIKNWNRNRP